MQLFSWDSTQINEAPGHSHGPGLRENVSMDVHHQVASCCVLHDKAHVLLCLKTRKQVDQEGMADTVHRFEDPLLTHQARKGRQTLWSESQQHR